MSISVIIPTLNEEALLARTIQEVRRLQPRDIIVVDAGSADNTHQAAAGADMFLECERGRARQMNFAARHANGEFLLFLHADCTLENGALEAARRCLRSRAVAACCFRQAVHADHWLYRCINWSAEARVRLTGLAYGDQGLFLRRDLFMRLGGYPELPLMEDLFFSQQLRRHGRIVVAPKRIFVSPRRWRDQGIIAQTLRNWSLTALAAAGVSPERLARFYPVVR